MASIGHGGSGFSINARDITNIGRDQVTHYHASSPLTVQLVSPDGRQALANPWTYDPLPIPCPNDPNLHGSVRYSLLLLSKREGYPLWYPQPKAKLPPEYRTTGVRIGDVGIVRSNTPFDYLFNVCQAANHPINSYGVPDGFIAISEEDVELSHSAEDIYRNPGTPVVVPGSIKLETDGTGDTNQVYRFTSPDAQGAILVLPDGSWREEVANIALFQRYAQKHSEKWFLYAETQRDRLLGPGAILYLVTGYERCSSWGVSSFLNVANPSETFSLPFNVTSGTTSDHKYCSWGFTGSNSCEARCYPGIFHNLPLDGQRPCNSCVFMQGFVVSRKPVQPDRFKVRDIDEVYAKATNTNDYTTFGHFKTHGGYGSRSSTSMSPSSGSGSHRGIYHAYSTPVPSNTTDDILIDYQPGDPMTFHPCNDLINPFLLAISEQVGDASIAISHDRDWGALLTDEDEVLPSERELISRLAEKFKFSVQDSIVYLEPLTDDQSESKDIVISTSFATERVIMARVDVKTEQQDSGDSSDEEESKKLNSEAAITLVDFGPRGPDYKHYNIMAYTLSSSSNPSNRETIRTATSALCNFLASSRLQWVGGSGSWEEVERRINLLADLERCWSIDGSNSPVTPTEVSVRLSLYEEEKEKRLFGEALRDGYVLSHLINNLQSNLVLQPDPNENGVDSVSNLWSFLTACTLSGVSQDNLFQISDLVAASSKSLARVANTILKLLESAEPGSTERRHTSSPLELDHTLSDVPTPRMSEKTPRGWGVLHQRSSNRRRERASSSSPRQFSPASFNSRRARGKHKVPPAPSMPPPLPPQIE
uniref:Uncharacterized protein n=3 Tax=Moniliophthora roreri TaxID=221103 RepID=A0A0W0G5T5_MONRR